jgi:hypothetical protein
MGGSVGVCTCIVWLCLIIYCYDCFHQFIACLFLYYCVCVDNVEILFYVHHFAPSRVVSYLCNIFYFPILMSKAIWKVTAIYFRQLMQEWGKACACKVVSHESLPCKPSHNHHWASQQDSTQSKILLLFKKHILNILTLTRQRTHAIHVKHCL